MYMVYECAVGVSWDSDLGTSKECDLDGGEDRGIEAACFVLCNEPQSLAAT